MASSRESISERNIESNKPSSHSSTSHNVQSKITKNNKIKDVNTKSSPLKKSPRQKHDATKNSNKTTNVLNALNEMSKLSSQLNNVELRSEVDDLQRRENSEQQRRKNAKKKERLKRLHMPRDSVTYIPRNNEQPVINDAALHQYFVNGINPLYPIASPSYLQNLHNHPQFQLANSLVVENSRRRTVSVPSAPLMQLHNFPGSSISRSPGAQSAPNTPGFLQNVMQHPLLSKTVPVTPNNKTKNSPKHKKNKNTNTEDTKFEPYMSAEEVETGLKNNTLIKGILRINPKQFQYAYVSSNDRDEQDIFIDGMKHRNRALEGDVVIIQYVIVPEVEKDVENCKKKSSKRSKKESSKQSKLDSNKDHNLKSNKEGNVESNKKGNVNSVKEDNIKSNNEGGKNRNEIGDIEHTVEDNIHNKVGTKEIIMKSNIESNEEVQVTIKMKENDDEDNKEFNKEGDTESSESNIENNKQKRGKVVFIKEKVHKRTCIGNLKLLPDKNRQRALFVPKDSRIPRLNIPFSCWPDNFYNDHEKYENTLFLAMIEDWYDIRYAIGKIICNIGQAGDMVAETKAILAQNDLDITPFGPEVKHLYPRPDYNIPEDEIGIREDCRRLCIFSIDPPNCRDIDDAVSCQELENGNYEVGVHISDVTHFLTEDTLLDQRVSEKATTIYLVERAYHMLPDDLCMLCSLFPGVDKLAFSVFFEIDDGANVLKYRYSKTVINSCCQLSYDHAQAVLENKEDAEFTFPEMYNGFKFVHVQKTIKVLGKLASILRNNRFLNGALRIDQPKISFKLNAQNGLPETFCVYENKECHQLIEEFMLLANMTVAKSLCDYNPDIAFLRCHPPPSNYMLKSLAKILNSLGIDLKISSAGDLHSSLMEHMASGDRGKSMVLNMLCAKPMSRAKYFCAHGCNDDDFHHYALNVPLYTHFTSPIRRYADIMVHRLLGACINFRSAPDWEVDKVSMVASQCNKQKYNAKRAGEMSTELYTLKYIELNSPVVTEAVVVEIREKFLDTLVPSLGLNRKIFFNKNFPGEAKYIKDKDNNDAKLSKMEIVWKGEDDSPEVYQTIEIFSILKIALTKGEGILKIDALLLKPQ